MSSITSARFKELVIDHKNLFEQVNNLETQVKALDTQGLSSSDTKSTIQKMVIDVEKQVKEIAKTTAAEQEKLEETLKEVEDRFDAMEKRYQKSRGNVSDILHASVGDAVGAQAFKSLEADRAESLSDEQLNKIHKTARQDFPIKLNMEPEFALKGSRIPSQAYHQKLLTALGTSGSTPSDGQAGQLLIPTWQDYIQAPGQERITLLDVIPTIGMTGTKLYWFQEVLGTSRDKVGLQSLDFTGTGQGDALTEANFKFRDFNAETRTFGTYTKFALQILQDVPYLQGYIDNQLMYIVRWDLERRIVRANPTTNDSDKGLSDEKNFQSLNGMATAYDLTLVTDLGVASPQRYDVLRLAKLQGDKTFFPTTHFVLNPDDHAALQLTKDNDGKYMFPNDKLMTPWGIPVVMSYQFTQGDFFCLPMNQINLLVRKTWDSGISYEDQDDFIKLKCTLRMYGRYGLICYRPGSVFKGTFPTALA